MPSTALQRMVPVVIGALVASLAMALLVMSPVSADATLSTTLTGEAEVPGPGDNDGSGSGTVEIVGDEICFSVQWELSVDDNVASAGHIHQGAADEAGSIVLPLFTEPNDTGMVDGCATDATLAAELEADPGNYYINIHSETFPDGALRGQLAAEAVEADTVTIMVMKHNCANVTSTAEFEEVEARAATNPTTPDAAFGPTVETVLECPTVVLPGDTQTDGAVAGGESTFDFTVAGETGDAFTVSADGTYQMTAACETDVEYDADRSGELDADVCLDLSHYAITVGSGTVTVTETVAPSGLSFGALRFTPGSGDDATLVSAENGVIVLDTSADEDGMVMLHVYNFAAAAAATPAPTPAATPAPAATALPDTAGAPSATGAPEATLLGLGLTALALASLGVLGYRTVTTRRVR